MKSTPTPVSRQPCNSALWIHQCWGNLLCVFDRWCFFPSRPWPSVSLNLYISVCFLFLPLSLSLTLSPCLFLPFSTGAIVKHWPESQALRRLRGSGLTDRWISPQGPRTRIVQEAFPSHWDPCGLRIPGFCCNNKAKLPHTLPKEKTAVKLCIASYVDVLVPQSERLEFSDSVCNNQQTCCFLFFVLYYIHCLLFT